MHALSLPGRRRLGRLWLRCAMNAVLASGMLDEIATEFEGMDVTANSTD